MFYKPVIKNQANVLNTSCHGNCPHRQINSHSTGKASQLSHYLVLHKWKLLPKKGWRICGRSWQTTTFSRFVSVLSQCKVNPAKYLIKNNNVLWKTSPAQLETCPNKKLMLCHLQWMMLCNSLERGAHNSSVPLPQWLQSSDSNLKEQQGRP